VTVEEEEDKLYIQGRRRLESVNYRHPGDLHLRRVDKTEAEKPERK